MLREIRNWPENFRVLQYPTIQAFHRYPTIAPNERIIHDDINGRACSIELYLPDSIIAKDGKYYPVEWESRIRITCENDEKISRYQGVISNKDWIKKQFHKLRNGIEKGELIFEPEEWHRMKQLIDTIVFAFVE